MSLASSTDRNPKFQPSPTESSSGSLVRKDGRRHISVVLDTGWLEEPCSCAEEGTLVIAVRSRACDGPVNSFWGTASHHFTHELFYSACKYWSRQSLDSNLSGTRMRHYNTYRVNIQDFACLLVAQVPVLQGQKNTTFNI